MSPRVAVVTDSTACCPGTESGITVVPLQLTAEGGSVSPERAVELLRERPDVATSRPSPDRFARVYAAAAASGAEGVVSVHVSREISGTLDSARLGAADAAVEVRVIDSRTIGMGLGYAAAAAAAVAARGGTLDEVAGAAEKAALESRTIFLVDTLGYLLRGGRAGSSGAASSRELRAALPVKALPVKYLLHVEGGRIVPLEKVRTVSRALARMAGLPAGDPFASGKADVGVQHFAAPERADALAIRLREEVPGLRSLHVAEVSAVLGAHVGPGMVGLTVAGG